MRIGNVCILFVCVGMLCGLMGCHRSGGYYNGYHGGYSSGYSRPYYVAAPVKVKTVYVQSRDRSDHHDRHDRSDRRDRSDHGGHRGRGR